MNPLTLTNDFVAVSTDKLKAQMTDKEFTCIRGGKEVCIPKSKLGTRTSDKLINLVKGLAIVAGEG